MIIKKSDLLRALEFCASDNTRPSLASVNIEERDGEIYIASTDSYRLHEVRAEKLTTPFPKYQSFFPDCTTRKQDTLDMIEVAKKSIALDKKEPKVYLTPNGAQVSNGEKPVDIPSKYRGDHDCTVIVNGEFLLDILKKIPKDKQDTLAIGVKSSMEPVLLTFGNDRHILMPLK
jgi:DNA polymerase III sliding clamp (beta) subunit (PCNA family)